jgi:hypothetical protein
MGTGVENPADAAGPKVERQHRIEVIADLLVEVLAGQAGGQLGRRKPCGSIRLRSHCSAFFVHVAIDEVQGRDAAAE